MRSSSAGEACGSCRWLAGRRELSRELGLDLEERTTGSCGNGQEGAFCFVPWST